MSGLEIVLTCLTIISTLSSIIFAYLAFNRNKINDIKKNEKSTAESTLNSAVDLATIKIDMKYTREGIDKISKRLEEIEKFQNGTNENIIKIFEHLKRHDERISALELKINGR